MSKEIPEEVISNPEKDLNSESDWVVKEILTHAGNIQEPLAINTRVINWMEKYILPWWYYTVKLEYAVDESEWNLLSWVQRFAEEKRTDDTLDFSELIVGHGVDFESIQWRSCIWSWGDSYYLYNPLEVKW